MGPFIGACGKPFMDQPVPAGKPFIDQPTPAGGRPVNGEALALGAPNGFRCPGCPGEAGMPWKDAKGVLAAGGLFGCACAGPLPGGLSGSVIGL